MSKNVINHKVLLAFDTSCPLLNVSLQKEHGEIHEQNFESSTKHAENLLPAIDTLLKKENLTIKDVDAFLIGRGPGSFTGLRIGFATLKGFLQVFKRPVFGSLSLDMIAENVPAKKGQKLTSCLDAHRERLFLKTFEEKNGQWEKLQGPIIASKDEALDHLYKENLIVGDALKKHREFFLENSKKFDLLDTDFWYPKAASMIRWYRQSEKAGQLHDKLKELKSSEELLPFYFRLSQPEEMRQENAKHH
jgi:tRNA threonylcarbamoyladenosine biosynthesis protein TsaB